MTPRNTCDNPINTIELMHNCAVVRDGDVYYKCFDQEFPLLDLTRDLLCRYSYYTYEEVHSEPDDLSGLLRDNLQFAPAEDIDGLIAAFYFVLIGAAENRQLLKLYETVGLPTTSEPKVLQQCIDTYGVDKQVDQTIEEMSELTKAFLKYRRKEYQNDGKNVNPTSDGTDLDKARVDILEETADVIVMLMQIIMIYGGRDEVQKNIDQKVERQKKRLEGSSDSE